MPARRTRLPCRPTQLPCTQTRNCIIAASESVLTASSRFTPPPNHLSAHEPRRKDLPMQRARRRQCQTCSLHKQKQNTSSPSSIRFLSPLSVSRGLKEDDAILHSILEAEAPSADDRLKSLVAVLGICV